MALCVEHTTNVYRVQQKKAFKIMCRRMPFENVHLTLGLYEDKNVLAWLHASEFRGWSYFANHVNGLNCAMVMNFMNIQWMVVVASWYLNSGPHQKNHKIRIMHVTFIHTSPQNVANKTLLTKRGQRKLWKAALCYEDLVSFSETALCCGSLLLQRNADAQLLQSRGNVA